MQNYVWLHCINLSRCTAWSQVWRHKQNSETWMVPQAKTGRNNRTWKEGAPPGHMPGQGSISSSSFWPSVHPLQGGNCQFCSLPHLSSFSRESWSWSRGHQADLRADCSSLVEQAFQLRSLWFPSLRSVCFLPIKRTQGTFRTEDTMSWRLCLRVLHHFDPSKLFCHQQSPLATPRR